MILKRELYQRHGYFKGILIVLSFQISRLFKLFLSLFKKDDGRLTVSEDQKLSKYKGMLALTVNKQGEIQCTGCGLCQAVCPSDCIDIQFDKKKKGVGAFNIDLLRCVFCGLCVDACPFYALYMSNDYELSSFTKEGLIYTPQQLQVKPNIQQDSEIQIDDRGATHG